MLDFLIKSTLSLGILYLFYILVLSGLKTFHFNRFFLLGAIIFSLIIPFIVLPLDNDIVPVPTSSAVFTMRQTIEHSSEIFATRAVNDTSAMELWPYIYAAISLILLFRFNFNLFNIIKKIRQNQKEVKPNYKLVLVDERVLPHTFFKYILVNRENYKTGKIDDLLILHEITHCTKWHSIDIVIIELVRIFLWINPFIWLIKRPISLNQEYLADNSVISKHSLKSYQYTLVNTVLSNNKGALISNFNFSLTKQRLKMMTKHFSPKRAAIGKTLAIFMFLIIGFAISCNEDSIDRDLATNNNQEWWEPILKEHGIKRRASNNFEQVLEMGTSNSITNGIVSLENAFFLIKPANTKINSKFPDTYIMVESSFATHDLNTDSIKTIGGNMRIFNLNEDKITSISHINFSELKMFINDKKFRFRVDKGTTTEESFDGKVIQPEKYFDNIVVRWD